MADLLNVKVITPKQVAYDGQALAVTIPAETGQMQVFKGHIPVLARVTAGEVCIEKPGEAPVRFTVDEGFFRVTHDEVSLLIDSVETL
ncbi:MAG: F0F1 ATP synthase subunit epsilon [Pontiellaceae bacterium]|nr:F0F1 ATP synthase subunit epsilon [Pontiellaceae bacterium]MBN2783194.1 F0F1 ATP synthase subunit epsilon [Pontiellaceae bacterium]